MPRNGPRRTQLAVKVTHAGLDAVDEQAALVTDSLRVLGIDKKVSRSDWTREAVALGLEQPERIARRLHDRATRPTADAKASA